MFCFDVSDWRLGNGKGGYDYFWKISQWVLPHELIPL